jgi:hypothetical protein
VVYEVNVHVSPHLQQSKVLELFVILVVLEFEERCVVHLADLESLDVIECDGTVIEEILST